MVIDTLASASEVVEPLNAVERAVAALWSEVLQTAEPPGANDNFFSMGGDSMTMVMFEFRIKEELSVELPVGALLNAPTLRELAALVDASRSALVENSQDQT